MIIANERSHVNTFFHLSQKGLAHPPAVWYVRHRTRKMFEKEENSMLSGFEKFLDAFFDIFGGFFASILWWLDNLSH